MKKKPRNIFLVSGLGLLVATVMYQVVPDPSIKPITNHHAEDTAYSAKPIQEDVITQPSMPLDIKSLSGAAAEDENKLAMLNHPNVTAYLEKEKDKAVLNLYFNPNPNPNPNPNTQGDDITDQQAWDAIERIEDDGRVFAFEALTLKLQWLEKNSHSEIEFEAQSKNIIAEYKERARQSAKQYDPNNVAGFSEYKKEEARIVKEISAMQFFPDGMNKQQYLRQQLLAARLKAYGS